MGESLWAARNNTDLRRYLVRKEMTVRSTEFAHPSQRVYAGLQYARG